MTIGGGGSGGYGEHGGARGGVSVGANGRQDDMGWLWGGINSRRAVAARQAEFYERTGLSDYEVEALAQYNAERSRGVLHTPGYMAAMAELQRQFDQPVKPGVTP